MLKDYQQPKRDWGRKQWVDYCHIMIHSPHINKDEIEYYKDKLHDLTNNNRRTDYSEQSNKDDS